MTVQIDNTFFSNPVGSMTHGLPEVEDFAVEATRNTFFGVRGAQINYSQQHYRKIKLAVTLHNFSDEAVIREHVFSIRRRHGLNGTLRIVNFAGTAVDWPVTAFVGFEERGVPTWDASGRYRWTQLGMLIFEQVAS